MNRNFYIEGYELVMKNAKSLLDLAEKSSASKNYGNGTSLSILSAEESIKALIILAQSIDASQKLDGFDKTFRDHKTKHAYIKAFSFIIDFFVKTMSKRYYETAKSMNENRQLFEDKVLSNNVKGQTMQWILDRKGKLPNLNQLLSWWENANSDKNDGLYVDLVGSTWKSPASFSNEKFQQSFNYSVDLFEYATFSKSLFTNPEMLSYYKKHGLTNG